MELEIIDQQEFDKRSLLEPEFKAQWCAALRSGKYEQGTKNLLKDGKYCCLGVACEIQGRPKEFRKDKFYFDNNSAGISGDNPLSEILRGLGDFVGFNINDSSSLASMNDNGYTLEQIAEVIELDF